jgi:hypothetical protein
MAGALHTSVKVRMPGAYYTPGETPIAANSESATTPPATQVSSVSVLSTLQKPPEGGNPTTPDLAVVAQLSVDNHPGRT